MTRNNELAEQERIRETVRAGYAAVAVAETPGCGSTSCCGGQPDPAAELARAVGYSDEDLQALPEGANLGLSCGNPIALAGLREGEVVLDLGSGGGFDVFQAGRRVGPTGRAIGVDMTPEMLARARRNAATYREKNSMDNVEFRLGEIENLPVADASVDVVISNCVINLSPDKRRVYAEIARVLKPGGRIAVSDIVLKKPLPAEVAQDAQALVGCVAGALLVEELREAVEANGLSGLVLAEKPGFVRAMETSGNHIAEAVKARMAPGETLADYIASMDISASKPVEVNPRHTPVAKQAGQSQTQEQKTMRVHVYDPPMCCGTGACGPDPDPRLAQFAGDLRWLESQGVEVRRFNLSQEPAAFAASAQVKAALQEGSTDVLPIIEVDGRIASRGEYPDRVALAAMAGLQPAPAAAAQPEAGGCCGSTGCC